MILIPRKGQPKVLAVIGGGRWARVIISVLEKMDLDFDHLVCVSKYNFGKMESFFEKLDNDNKNNQLNFGVFSTITELLNFHKVTASIIVNKASQHFDTAASLIEAGSSVLIEKPIVSSSVQMEILEKIILKENIAFIPGLNYRFCAYLHNFSRLLKSLRKPCGFSIEWFDPAYETRYGEVKIYDRDTNIAEDIMPHIWTILNQIFSERDIYINSCDEKSDNSASFSVTVANIPGNIYLSRDAISRKRKISIVLEGNESASIDFSIEPGIISINEQGIVGDQLWHQSPSPLTKQLNYFQSVIQKNKTQAQDLRDAFESVKFTEYSTYLLQQLKKAL